MQGFEVAWLRWLWLMIGMGAGLIAVLVLGFYVAGRSQPPAQPASPEKGEGPAPPVPLLLTLLYIAIAVFMIAYVLYVWLGGVTY
jgi:hypothetical protein